MPGALIELPGLSRRYVTGVDGRVTFEIRRTTTVVEVAMAIDAVVLLAEFYEPGRVPDRFGGNQYKCGLLLLWSRRLAGREGLP